MRYGPFDTKILRSITVMIFVGDDYEGSSIYGTYLVYVFFIY